MHYNASLALHKVLPDRDTLDLRLPVLATNSRELPHFRIEQSLSIGSNFGLSTISPLHVTVRSTDTSIGVEGTPFRPALGRIPIYDFQERSLKQPTRGDLTSRVSSQLDPAEWVLMSWQNPIQRGPAIEHKLQLSMDRVSSSLSLALIIPSPPFLPSRRILLHPERLHAHSRHENLTAEQAQVALAVFQVLQLLFAFDKRPIRTGFRG